MVIGNILSLEAHCKNKLKEFNLINSVLIDGNLDSSEKMKEIIKFCNPSNKLVNKILVIAQDDHTSLCLHLMKIYGEIKMSFPLEIIESYTILKEKNEKFHDSLQDFNEVFLMKITFIEQVNWEDMILVFLTEESLKKFEGIYKDFNENRQLRKKKFSLENNKSKIQNNYKEKKNTIWSQNHMQSDDVKKKSMMDDVMLNTFKMNASMEHFSMLFVFYIDIIVN